MSSLSAGDSWERLNRIANCWLLFINGTGTSLARNRTSFVGMSRTRPPRLCRFVTALLHVLRRLVVTRLFVFAGRHLTNPTSIYFVVDSIQIALSIAEISSFCNDNGTQSKEFSLLDRPMRWQMCVPVAQSGKSTQVVMSVFGTGWIFIFLFVFKWHTALLQIPGTWISNVVGLRILRLLSLPRHSLPS